MQVEHRILRLGVGFGFRRSGVRVWGSGFRVEGVRIHGSRLQGSGLRGSELRAEGGGVSGIWSGVSEVSRAVQVEHRILRLGVGFGFRGSGFMVAGVGALSRGGCGMTWGIRGLLGRASCTPNSAFQDFSWLGGWGCTALKFEATKPSTPPNAAFGVELGAADLVGVCRIYTAETVTSLHAHPRLRLVGEALSFWGLGLRDDGVGVQGVEVEG